MRFSLLSILLFLSLSFSSYAGRGNLPSLVLPDSEEWNEKTATEYFQIYYDLYNNSLKFKIKQDSISIDNLAEELKWKALSYTDEGRAAHKLQFKKKQDQLNKSIHNNSIHIDVDLVDSFYKDSIIIYNYKLSILKSIKELIDKKELCVNAFGCYFKTTNRQDLWNRYGDTYVEPWHSLFCGRGVQTDFITLIKNIPFHGGQGFALPKYWQYLNQDELISRLMISDTAKLILQNRSDSIKTARILAVEQQRHNDSIIQFHNDSIIQFHNDSMKIVQDSLRPIQDSISAIQNIESEICGDYEQIDNLNQELQEERNIASISGVTNLTLRYNNVARIRELQKEIYQYQLDYKNKTHKNFSKNGVRKLSY